MDGSADLELAPGLVRLDWITSSDPLWPFKGTATSLILDTCGESILLNSMIAKYMTAHLILLANINDLCFVPGVQALHSLCCRLFKMSAALRDHMAKSTEYSLRLITHCWY
jgi:hypothetical protein